MRISRRRAARLVVAAALIALLVPFVAAQVQEGWKFADPSYRVQLPRDHASHPAYKIEWWYYTGNLATAGGRRFGYQLTFFRVGVDPQPAIDSRWAVRDLYMAHLAVSDIAAGRFDYRERLNRAGPGWAGADTRDLHVWNEDWRVIRDERGRHRLEAFERGLGVSLVLEPGKAPVLHGDPGEEGFDRKGFQPGNASHYYSLTRMPTRGVIVSGGERYEVTGESWMDHEFGTSVLEPDQLGWDWFALQFSDGTELMVYQLRGRDRRPHAMSSATFVERDGNVVRLSVRDLRLDALDTWRSSASGAEYPIGWRVRIERIALDVRVRAALEAQELHTPRSTGVTYWEGPVDVSGRRGDRAIAGRGYLEMTGYAGRGLGRVLGNGTE